jgi:alpha-glucoside transport system substrate-binding protein
MRNTKRRTAAVAGGIGLALALAACMPSDAENDAGAGGGGDTSAEGGGGDTDCAAYEQYGDLAGTTVSVYTSIVEPEAEQQQASYEPFEECTGATIEYEGSREFEAQLLVRLQAGNAPDIAYLPQPGLLRTIVQTVPDAIVPAPEGVVSNVDEFYSEAWKGYGSVDGTFYAAPLGANVKSYVWYSPAAFEDAGYEVPETWDDMMSLTEEIAGTGAKPWCMGVGSGDATGWPATDFLEDVVLRSAGPEVYDQWVNHEIPFNDPQILEALQAMGEIVKNPDYVNGGLGEVNSIASTEWDAAGLPILEGSCWLHRAANFYQTQWPEGTEVAPDGDVYAFYMPAMNEGERPVLGGGEFVAAFDDRPEVAAFQAYLSSPEWANNKAIATPTGGWVSANTGLDPENLTTEFDRLSAEILSDPESEFRFDGSDLMPAAVGAGTFWTAMTNWFANDTPDEQVLDTIEASWPAS